MCPGCGCPTASAAALGGECDSMEYGDEGFSSDPPRAYRQEEGGTATVTIVIGCKGYTFAETKSEGPPASWSYSRDGDQTLAFDTETCEFTYQCDGSSLRFANHTGNCLDRLNPGKQGSHYQYGGGPTANSPTSVTRPVEQGGRVVTDRVDYSYISTGDNAGKLESSTWTRQTNPTSGLKRILYTYYGGDDPNGSLGDLRTTTTQLLRGTTWVDFETQYFRYYKAGDSLGFAGGLKYVLYAQAFARLKQSLSGGDPFHASDEVVARYADNYFEYDEDQRATKSVTAGGAFTYLYAYVESAHADGPNSWHLRTEVTRPDGSQEIVYSNSLTLPMLRELVSGSEHWITAFLYDSASRLIQEASPSAVVGYDDSAADLDVVLEATAGLIKTTTYYTTTTATPTTAGGAAGYAATTALQQGSTAVGGVKLQSETKYFERTAGEITIYPVAERSVYRNDTADVNDAGKITTEFEYAWHPDTVAIEQKTTIFPAVPTEQNGSGSATEQTEVYDLWGNRTWLRDPRGFISYWKYDVVVGAVVQSIQDVDTERMSDVPSGWETPPGGGLHLVTDDTVDAFGRTTETLAPFFDSNGQTVRTANWTVYRELEHETLSASGYAYGPAPTYEYELVNPVTISRAAADGLATESIGAVRAVTQGKLSAADCFPQSTWVSWSRTSSNLHGQQTSSIIYHTIPECGLGEPGANYDETRYGYDASGRRNRIVTPGGTITRTVFDSRGLTLQTFVGTNDAGATDDDPTGATSGAAAEGNDMVLTLANEYDGGEDEGDGNLTSTTLPVDDDAGHDRVTSYAYDFRNRQVSTTAPEHSFVEQSYDNLNHVVETTQRVDDASGDPIASGYADFDELGRVYKTEQTGYDATTHVETAPLTSLTWYDAGGNTIKRVAAGAKELRAFTKNTYDGAARNTAGYVGLYMGEQPEPYETVSSVADDLVFEQSVPTYDGAGHVVETTSFRRYPSDVTTTGPLDETLGRQGRSATWYDGVGRTVAAADYGTSTVERSSEPPPSTDEIPVSLTHYNPAGQAIESIDPMGRITRSSYDAAGRMTESIANYVCGCPGNETDVTVRHTYDADGHLKTLTAVNPDTGDQTTTYFYGVDPAGGSKLSSNDLLSAVVYPDAKDAADRVTYAYNRRGEAIAMTDQNGTTHAYDYDGLGRRTADRVTAIGTGVEGSVRRLETVYNDRQQVESRTSYDAPTGGLIANQIEYQYNPFGLLFQETQTVGADHGAIQYFYTDPAGGVNTVRKSLVVYPNSRQIRYRYGTAGTPTDLLSQIAELVDDNVATTLVEYTYLGASSIFRCDYLQPQVRWDLSPVGDTFGGLDSLNRVVDNLWFDYGASAPVDQVQYTYDRNGSRTSRANAVATSGNDELYRYDGLNRLTNLARGTLTDGAAPLTAPQAGEAWRLDATGNWNGYESLDFTTPANTVEQNRTANAANEITAITAEVGPVWAQPLYDRAGNMISLPRPQEPTAGYTATYDAWNRLVSLDDGVANVALYAYDALTRRVIIVAGGQTRHVFFSAQWQALEEWLDGFPDRQFVWGLRYIDDLVLRDRNVSGTLDERLYALQDANWNVTAIVDTAGDVEERYRYSAYGSPTFLDASFAPRTPNESDFEWETLYCGYRYDEDSGLYCVRFRYLNPAVGTWATRDPVGYSAGDMNLSRYVNNNTLRAHDPSGLDKFYICGRPIDAKSTVERCAKACGFHHVDMYTDDEGKIRQGFEGGVYPPESAMQGRPKGDGWVCEELKREDTITKRFGGPLQLSAPFLDWLLFETTKQVDQTLSWGAVGTPCKDASEAQLIQCIREKPKPLGKPNPASNCQTDVEDAARGCCLTGYTGHSTRNFLLLI